MKYIFLTIAYLATYAFAFSFCTGDKYDQGYCKITSVENNYDPNVARATPDCEGLCEMVADHGGHWNVVLTGNDPATLMNVNNCSLRLARGIGQANPLGFRVAKQDILDLVDGTIILAHATGVTWVPLKGNMTCDGKDVNWWVD